MVNSPVVMRFCEGFDPFLSSSQPEVLLSRNLHSDSKPEILGVKRNHRKSDKGFKARFHGIPNVTKSSYVTW